MKGIVIVETVFTGVDSTMIILEDVVYDAIKLNGYTDRCVFLLFLFNLTFILLASPIEIKIRFKVDLFSEARLNPSVKGSAVYFSCSTN